MPMAGGMRQMYQSGRTSGAVTTSTAPEPCSSPQRFGQGGSACHGLSPGASPQPIRQGSCFTQGLSPGASPLRDNCPGTPEQYASYPMPSGTESVQQSQLDFDIRNGCNDNQGPQCPAGMGQCCQPSPDVGQCMTYQGSVPTMMMIS